MFRLLRQMRTPAVHLRPSLRTWTAVVSACARAGDAGKANEAFERMTAAGVVADAQAWTALMNAHAARGDSTATAATYRRMRQAGIMPDEATLGAALTAGRRGGGDASAAIAIYRDMRSLNVRPNNAGFRQLTEMWVDQAFAAGTVGESGSGCAVPNFMLANMLVAEGDAVDRRKPMESSGPRAATPVAGSPLVDVHGLSTVETRAAVLSVLQALRERRRARLPVSGDLVIVTGLGRHSEGEPMLRDAVERLARDLQLQVAVVEGNAGRLVAREDALLAWLDRGGRSGSVGASGGGNGGGGDGLAADACGSGDDGDGGGGGGGSGGGSGGDFTAGSRGASPSSSPAFLSPSSSSSFPRSFADLRATGRAGRISSAGRGSVRLEEAGVGDSTGEGDGRGRGGSYQVP